MTRLRLLFVALVLLLPLTAIAQPAPPAPTPAPTPTHAPALTPAQARAALEVLNNPQKRAEFTATLEAIAAAHPPVQPSSPAAAGGTPSAPATQPAAPAAQPSAAQPSAAQPSAAQPSAPGAGQSAASPAQPAAAPSATPTNPLHIPLAPDSLGAQVLLGAASFMNYAAAQVVKGLHAVQSVPLLWSWVVVMTTNPWARSMLDDTLWRLAVVMVVALAVEFALRRAMLRPINALERMASNGLRHPEPGPLDLPPPGKRRPDLPPEDFEARAEAGDTRDWPPDEPGPHARRHLSAWSQMRRVPLVLLRLLLDLVPVLGFLVAGHLITGSVLGGQAISRLVLLAVVDAYALCLALLAVARTLLSPVRRQLRLLNLRDDIAAYLMWWTRRLVVIAVFGYAAAEVGLLLGLSDVAHEGVLKAVGFILHACLAIIVIQKRRAVRARLRASPDATGLGARLRNGLAASWHWIALFFIIGIWAVWAIEVPHGFAWMLRVFTLTAVLLIGARLFLIVVLGSIDRALHIGPGVSERYPGLEGRLRVYAPVIHGTIRSLVYLLCLLGLLQLYGVPTFSFFAASQLGLRMLSASATMIVTILIALAVWEVANAAIQSHLSKLDRSAQIARSARLRTLLPLLRSGLMISILIVAGLMVLSEIGLNIAPLLAGAGIIGVAIGFGSQKLVQDLITGIFLLLENAMQVGDVVEVSGQIGIVESLSVRTIRLRSEDGSVYVIPFSSVTTVTNMTKDYSRAVILANVAYKEDYDYVLDVLKTLAKELRADPAWQSMILDDLEVWGLDQLSDSSVVIKCRIMCTPFSRWAVKREFIRRMKKRFDQLGIEIPFPHRKLVIEGALPVQHARPEVLPAGETAARPPEVRPA